MKQTLRGSKGSMAKILEPRRVTGTTRYYFEVKLDFTSIRQLLKEFRTEDYEIHINEELLFIKLINKKGSGAIEINDNFISFYPELDDVEAEKVRSRIYKLVAKKSEVYLRTSGNNIELAIISLLKNDLRGTASLLYYSLHKSINGFMYHYFNEKLELDDYVIDVDEVAHFTSALYYKTSKDTEFSLESNLNSENYLEILCNNRNKSVNPYLILIYILNDKFEKKDLIKYMNYLVNKLFEYETDPVILVPKLEKFKTDFFKAHNKRETNQKYEVKAAIADCIIRYHKSESNNINFLIYVFAIRLYWLRQTADYDFDFEVETSIREISLLTNIVKTFVEIGHTNIVKQNIEKGKTASSNDYNVEEENYLDEADLYYNVDQEFDSEIEFEGDITYLMLVLHLDFDFNHKHILDALNLIGSITNRGKYFIYESTNKAILHLFVSEEGKWTFWFGNSQMYMLNGTDLRIATLEFLDIFNKKFKETYDYSFDDFLIKTEPTAAFRENDTLSASSIYKINNALSGRIRMFSFEIVKILSKKFHLNISGYNTLEIEDVTLIINLATYKGDLFDLVSLGNVLNMNENNSYILEIIIADDLTNKEEFIGIYEGLLYLMEEKYNLGTINKMSIMLLESYELEDIVSSGNNINNKFWEKTLTIMNQISYYNINNNSLDFDLIYKILETCLQIDAKNAFINATLGFWHLRNPMGDINEGKAFYEKAIKFEEGKENNYLIDFKQKFYLEYAKALIERLSDIEEGVKYLQKAFDVGEEGNSYEDVKELIEVHKIDLNQPQTDSNVIEEIAATTEELEHTTEEDVE